MNQRGDETHCAPNCVRTVTSLAVCETKHGWHPIHRQQSFPSANPMSYFALTPCRVLYAFVQHTSHVWHSRPSTAACVYAVTTHGTKHAARHLGRLSMHPKNSVKNPGASVSLNSNLSGKSIVSPGPPAPPRLPIPTTAAGWEVTIGRAFPNFFSSDENSIVHALVFGLPFVLSLLPRPMHSNVVIESLSTPVISFSRISNLSLSNFNLKISPSSFSIRDGELGIAPLSPKLSPLVGFWPADADLALAWAVRRAALALWDPGGVIADITAPSPMEKADMRRLVLGVRGDDGVSPPSAPVFVSC
eukprot:comp12285_c0_seq1/m.7112 comp12285_c0_seq1/g.7112  ORF comp12285_c0_seq1/g.7112 comp12285_c0_seq1/m.7112 type:complete len:303 (+) comp12285_c0_seq1:692-1600(+)